MNRRDILTACVLYTIFTHIAAKELVITQSYKPARSVAHSTLFNSAVTALFTLGSGFVYTNCTELNPPTCAILGGASFLLFRSLIKEKSLLDKLLTDPVSALDHNYTLAKKLEAETIPAKKDVLRAQYAKQEPLFLLDECTKQGCRNCVLSRTYEPKFREVFESRVVSSLCQQLSLHERPIEYVGFASGGMFQDHVILTKTLAKRPDARINIHLIDIKYITYIACKDLLKDTREVHPDINTDPTRVIRQLRQYARANSDDAKEINNKELAPRLINVCKWHESRGQQSIAWLRKTFPCALLKLHLHNTTDSYYKYIDRTKTNNPDVIATADIEDELSITQLSIKDYLKLCVLALKRNPMVQNTWLTRDYGQGGSLANIQLFPSAGAQAYFIQIGNAEVPFYETSEEIKPSFLRRLINEAR